MHKNIIIFVITFFTSLGLSAQSGSLKGTVSDAMTGETIPMANIVIKSDGVPVIGSASDFDGNYYIEVPQGSTLEFSFVGYGNQTFLVNESTGLDVTLFPDNELEEVVVVAFGKQTKETIVGSVAVISSESLNNQSATTITQAIQGSIPGINIINPGGIPGTNPTIRIRGIGSINAEASPLIIVDGAPFNGNLNSIAQEQVASISVLKDASSTSLYGSRGANGVIIISTKSGTKSTETSISLSSSYGNSSMATSMHKLLDINSYTRYFWEGYRNRELYENNNSPEVASTLASNNLVASLLVTTDWTVLQTNAILKDEEKHIGTSMEHPAIRISFFELLLRALCAASTVFLFISKNSFSYPDKASIRREVL